MSQIAYLEAIVGADISSFRRGMTEVRAEIAETTGLGQGLTQLGTALTLGLTVPLVGVGFAAVKAFSSFDEGMRNVNSIMQLSEEQLKSLSSQILDLGQSSRKGSVAASEALYTIVSAGFGVKDTAEAVKLLGVAIQGAEAGMADQNIVAQTLAQSLLAYGQSADSASHFMDVLAQTVALGVGSMDDVASSMGQAISIAALAKVSFDDLNGSAAFLTQRGMSFANAYTSLNQVISQLIKPTEGLKAAFKELGVASGTELIEKYGGLGGALQALSSVAGTSADDLAKLFTNVRALRGVASIIGNFSSYTDLMNEFGQSLNGVTGKQWIQQSKSFQAQLDRTGSEIQAFLIKAGDAFHTIFKPVIDGIAEFATSLGELDQQTVQNIVTIGLLVAAIGPLTFLLGALLSPLGLILGAVILLGKAWNDNFLGIRDAVAAAIPNIKSGFDAFVSLLQTVAFYAGYYFNNIKEAFNIYLNEDLTELLHDVLVGNWQKASFDLQQIWIDLVRLFNDKIKTPLTTAIDNFVADVKQKMGDFFSQFSPERFAGIVIGIGSIATVLIVANLPALIGLISDAFLLLSTNIALVIGLGGGGGLIGLAIAAAPLVGIIAVIIGLVWAWSNNFLGLRDRAEELRQTILKLVDAFQRLFLLGPYQILTPEQLQTATLPNGDTIHQLVPGSGNTPKWGKDTQNTGSPKIAAGSGIKRDYSDIAKAAGYSNSSQVNNIMIVSNDPDMVLSKLRAKGIDLEAKYNKRG